MANRTSRISVIAFFFLSAILASIVNAQDSQHSKTNWSPLIPRTWDDEAMLSLELPLADPAASPKHISSDYYYRIPVRPIYKSYPVYHPDKEPGAYMDWLKKQEPQIVFDVAKLRRNRTGSQRESSSLMRPSSLYPRARCFQGSGVVRGMNKTKFR